MRHLLSTPGALTRVPFLRRFNPTLFPSNLSINIPLSCRPALTVQTACLNTNHLTERNATKFRSLPGVLNRGYGDSYARNPRYARS